jgi:hypothetical protein
MRREEENYTNVTGVFVEYGRRIYETVTAKRAWRHQER